MAKKQPTTEQLTIIKHPSSCAVLAGPGSGKTFTIAEKIKLILKNCEGYQGIIAISYTNKASDELKHRCLADGTDQKASFFGTIHNFCFREIILPFGNRVLGSSRVKVDIIKYDDLNEELRGEYSALPLIWKFENIEQSHIDFFRKLFQSGIVVLETIGFLALHILKNSVACKRYLAARYLYVFIDEYQDAKRDQHQIFLELYELGIKGIAVGDALQAIYVEKAECLDELQNNPAFEPLELSINHRSHPSIQDYAWFFYTGQRHSNSNYEEIRVFEKKIKGSEIEIAKWLNIAVPYFKNLYHVDENRKIGILVHLNIKLDIISPYLTFECKISGKSPLEEISNPTSSFYQLILEYLSSNIVTRFEILDRYLFGVRNRNLAYKTNLKLIALKSKKEASANLSQHINEFEELGRILLGPDYDASISGRLMECLLADPELESFKPPERDQVQIMTIHKSKGLEFDVVFHLDLYEWSLPAKRINDEGKKVFMRIQSDACLHYVGITRAKMGVILCTSTKRHTKKWGTQDIEIKDGNPSEFLYSRDGIEKLRLASPI